jgi:hypothetical protein
MKYEDERKRKRESPTTFPEPQNSPVNYSSEWLLEDDIVTENAENNNEER